MGMRIADEVHHHTADEISGYITEAKRILEEQEFDPFVAAELLVQVVSLLSAKQVQVEVVQGQGVMLGQGLNRHQRRHG